MSDLRSTPAVTVIIPAFNAAPWIPMIFDGLDQQTFRDFETIFVNNGSTDGTGALLDNYAAFRDRVKVLHQPNRGVSKARNTAVNAAVGEFIVFIDADDAITPSHLSDLFSLATSFNLDVSMCNGWRFRETPGDMNQPPLINIPKPEGVMSGVEWCETTFNAGEWSTSPWMTMVRREFLHQNAIRFLERSYAHEDVLWASTVQSKAARVAYTPKQSYYYRLTPGSILGDESLSGKLKRINGYIAIIEELWRIADSETPRIAELMKRQAAFQGRILLRLIAELGSFQCRIAISRELLKRRFLARLFREVETGLHRKRIARAYCFAWLGKASVLFRVGETGSFNDKLF